MISLRLLTVGTSFREALMNQIMELSMQVNGPKMDSDMEKDYKSGKMDPNMKVTGKTTWLTVEVD